MDNNQHNLNNQEEPKLFLWRGEHFLSASQSLLLPRNKCPFCSTPLLWNFWNSWTGDNHSYKLRAEKLSHTTCRLCGWGMNNYRHYPGGGVEYLNKVKILKRFSINSTKVAIEELGSHLRNRFSDIYSLQPYRFEELIADIFKNIGYKIEMTKKSRDGGVDLFLLTDSGGRFGIVQCKRYKKEKKVGIEIIDRLVGTALAFDTKQAYIVTTSSYSKHAIERVYSPNIRKYGFYVNFLDAYDILRLLKVYNEELPPPDKLSINFLAERGLIL